MSEYIEETATPKARFMRRFKALNNPAAYAGNVKPVSYTVEKASNWKTLVITFNDGITGNTLQRHLPSVKTWAELLLQLEACNVGILIEQQQRIPWRAENND